MTQSLVSMPHNVEAEQALLGAVLLRNDLLFTMPAVNPETFYEPLHGRIFAAICNAIDHGKIANPVTLGPIFKDDIALADLGGGAYLGKLVAASISVINIEDYTQVICDLANRRQIIETCINTIKKSGDISNHQTAGEIAADLSLAVDGSTAGFSRYRVIAERELTEKIYERMQNKWFATPFSTGLRKLDSAMGGGLYPGKLYGLVGRKKYGKTMMAGTISNALQSAHTKHLFLALEMGSQEIHQRSLAASIGCYESAFRSGFGESDDFLSKLADYAVAAKNTRHYLDAPGLRFNDLRTLLPSMIRKHSLTGFILDSWQLVSGKSERQSKVDHLDDVAQWLAECCKKYNVWGLVTAQENQDDNTRGGEGLRLACDQCYRIGKENVGSAFAWMDMMETRYTGWQGVGSKDAPALNLSEKFTHFEEMQSLTPDPVMVNRPVQENLLPD